MAFTFIRYTYAVRQFSIELIFIFFRKLTLKHIVQYSLGTLHSAAYSATNAMAWKNSATFSHRIYFSCTIALLFLMPLNIPFNFCFCVLEFCSVCAWILEEIYTPAVCLLLRFQWHIPIASCCTSHSLPLLGYSLWWLLPVTAQETTCISFVTYSNCIYMCVCVYVCKLI